MDLVLRYPTLAPRPSSAATCGVTQLERTFNDVRQTSTPVLSEVGTDAVNEINELKSC